MKFWVTVFSSILIFSCAGNNLPNGVLSLNQMKLIIWDLTRVSQYKETDDLHAMKDSTAKKKDITLLYQQVFSLHKVNKEDFYKSLNYYQNNPLLNKTLYDTLAAYASRQRGDLYKKGFR